MSNAAPPADLGWVPEEWRILASIAAALEPRRSTFKSKPRFGIALLGGGRFVLDPSAKEMLSIRWVEDTEVLILTNRKTLRDLASGAFDPEEPSPEHLFLWAGDDAALGELAAALAPGKSMVALRASKQ